MYKWICVCWTYIYILYTYVSVLTHSTYCNHTQYIHHFNMYFSGWCGTSFCFKTSLFPNFCHGKALSHSVMTAKRQSVVSAKSCCCCCGRMGCFTYFHMEGQLCVSGAQEDLSIVPFMRQWCGLRLSIEGFKPRTPRVHGLFWWQHEPAVTAACLVYPGYLSGVRNTSVRLHQSCRCSHVQRAGLWIPADNTLKQSALRIRVWNHLHTLTGCVCVHVYHGSFCFFNSSLLCHLWNICSWFSAQMTVLDFRLTQWSDDDCFHLLWLLLCQISQITQP